MKIKPSLVGLSCKPVEVAVINIADKDVILIINT